MFFLFFESNNMMSTLIGLKSRSSRHDDPKNVRPPHFYAHNKTELDTGRGWRRTYSLARNWRWGRDNGGGSRTPSPVRDIHRRRFVPLLLRSLTTMKLILFSPSSPRQAFCIPQAISSSLSSSLLLLLLLLPLSSSSSFGSQLPWIWIAQAAPSSLFVPFHSFLELPVGAGLEQVQESCGNAWRGWNPERFSISCSSPTVCSWKF